MVYNLTQVILVNNAGRTEEYLSTQEGFPARIAKNNFFFLALPRSGSSKSLNVKPNQCEFYEHTFSQTCPERPGKLLSKVHADSAVFAHTQQADWSKRQKPICRAKLVWMSNAQHQCTF